MKTIDDRINNIVEWFKKNQSSDTLPAEVKDEIQKIATQMTRLSARAKKARGFDATRIFTL
jgi:hypothetical protein